MVDKARNAIAEGSKGVLIQSPPGSGKSVVIATIAKKATEKKNHVLFIVHRKELAEQIQKTFKRQQVDKQHTTIMTVGKVVNRLDKLPYPSIIITDETHHSRAKTYKKIYDYYSDAFRLGFTATPWRMSGKGFTDIYDEMIKGKEVDWLIDNYFLAPFDYYAPTLADLEQLKISSSGDYTKKSMDEAVSSAIFGDVVEHYKKLANGRKTILYAHSVEASKKLAETFKEKGIEAIHADSKTPPKERSQIMNDFRNGEIPVLCNVDLISEGFDVPDCSCVILVRPTASLVLHLQQSMRSMRYQEDKKAIIIDHVGNYAKHGLPNTTHDWTIKDRAKKKKKDSDAPPIKQCPKCHHVVHSRVTMCDLCGHEFKSESPNAKYVDAELKKVDEVKFKTDYRKIRIQEKYGRKKVDELETLEDFYLFAMSRNYKLGWIKFKYAPLRNADFVTLHSVLKPIKEKYQNIFN